MRIPGVDVAGSIFDGIRDMKDKTIHFAADTKQQTAHIFNSGKAEAGNALRSGKAGLDKVGQVLSDDFHRAIARARNWPERHEVTIGKPSDEIGQLNSDGDSVVLSLTQEGKLQVGGGVKQQYGYSVVVEQVGNEPAPGSGGAPVSYNVTFDKNLLAGGYAELPVIIPFLEPVSDFEPVSELSIGAADSVTMNFATKAEAARAVDILGRVAPQAVLNDTQINGTNNPRANPLTVGGPGRSGVGIEGQDADFLRQHITSYSTELTGQNRTKARTELLTIGIEPRLDANAKIIRTVELPQNGQPGRLTYTISGDLTQTTKEKLGIPLDPLPDDVLKAEFALQNIVDNGRLTSEVSVTWDLPPGAFTQTVAGHPVPEASLFDSVSLGAPDEVSAVVQFDYQKLDLEISRTNMGRFTLAATAGLPGHNALGAVNDLLHGNIQPLLDAAGDSLQVTVSHEDIERHGFQVQPELGAKAFKLIEAKVSLIGNFGRDDFQNRHDISLGK